MDTQLRESKSSNKGYVWNISGSITSLVHDQY